MTLTRRAAVAVMAAPLVARGLPQSSRSRIAITMDDVNWQAIPEAYSATAQERLLSALGTTQAALFVVGQYVNNPGGKRILQEWNGAGHVLGNHTFSHIPIYRSTPAEFEGDILRNEPVLREYLRFRKIFRFPVLKEGSTREVRDRLRGFLKSHGYRNGAVTIDASDWYYSQRLTERLKAEPRFDVSLYRKPYLTHLWERALYYDGLSRAVLGRSVPHTLLIHYNVLNVLFLADAIAMFRANRWDVIGFEDAFHDPVFTRQPDTLPAGESLLWSIARESGIGASTLRYPGEDGEYEKPVLDRLKL